MATGPPNGLRPVLLQRVSDLCRAASPPTTDNTFNTRQLGIRREEAILRTGGMAFVVAECGDTSGQLQLQAPQNGGLFVVRRCSEAELSNAIRRWRRI